jgi:hypothetical protein
MLDFGSKDLSGGIQVARDYFRSRNGVASIFMTDDCPRLIEEIGEYIWAEWKGVSAQEKHPLNKPRDFKDHLVEDMRRILQHGPRFVSYSAREGMFRRSGFVPLDPEAGY